MPYWTEGAITFHSSTPKKISITPNANHQVIHNSFKYTFFLNPTDMNSKVFPINKEFEFETTDPSLEALLIQAAFSNVCLEIAISDAPDPKVTQVNIPAKPRSP
jgi:hypothetical protein